MTYAGEVRHGVVVLKDAPQLEEGTPVTVEIALPQSKPRRGSPEAVLQAVARSGGWVDSAAEMADALEYIRQQKREDVKRQLAELVEPEPEL